MQSILDKKLEIKNKMEDYILNFYWLRGEYIRFKDIKKKFHPYCSEGSIANYLQELQDEKRIYKWNKNNIQYYGSPKKHVTTKYFIVFTLLFPVLAVPLAIFFNMFFYALSFYLGGIITVVFWHILLNREVE